MLKFELRYLKRGLAGKSQDLVACGVVQLQGAGMQEQARGLGLHSGACIKCITQNGVANGEQVYPQLVRTAGDGF